MPSTFLGLNTSYTGLVASNAGLNTTANNISNIETEGYSRQQVNQTAANALRTFTSYGCVGAGVDTLGAERVRDIFYDEKYWNNNSKLGEYDKKQYYAAQIENYLQDTKGSNAVEGFTTIFDAYTDALESLSTHSGDSNYALTFIGQAGNLCEYFNILYNSLQKMQTDINDEIKIETDQINSIGQKIASLNKQINAIELDGNTMANELRDKRDLLVDQLSKIIDVEASESPVIDTGSGYQTGATEYVVKIAGGQVLVDSYSYRTLECVPRELYEKENQNDVDGLYDIYWTDTGDSLNIFGSTTGGELKGLFEMRDGNNAEAFHGKVVGVKPAEQTVRIQVTDDYLMDLSKTTLPLAGGKITLGVDEYCYSSWEYELGEDGKGYYTFQLDETRNAEGVGTDKASKQAKVGTQVNYQGVAYYMEQMNEWIRDYASAFNQIYGQEGSTNYYEEADIGDCKGDIFFTGTDEITGVQYELGVALDSEKCSSTDDGYFRLTAGNFNVLQTLEKDPNLMATHTIDTSGVSNYDILKELKNMAEDTDIMQFRGCKASDFLVCMLGDAALNAESANKFQGIYQDIANTIQNNRLSISGVDTDEEAANMITYQNAYNLSSKMISVLCEVYDRLILETGV